MAETSPPLEKKPQVTGFAVRVTTSEGDMYLRRGSVPGRGPVMRFHDRMSADIAIEQIAPGLERGEVAVVCRYRDVPVEERRP